jgi:hypothetical protein
MAALILASVIPVAAHHSYAGTYALDQTTSITGTVVQFEIRNPHSFLSLESKDPNGKLVRWAVEWGSATVLTQTGVDKQTLKIGDMLSVTGRPSLDSTEHKVLTLVITRPADGWTWGNRSQEVLVGSSGFDPGQAPAETSAR